MSEKTRRRLMIELRSTENVVSIAAAARVKGSFELEWLSLTDLPGFDSDSQFLPTEIPRVPRSADGRMLDFTLGPPVAGPEEPTYIIRGEIDEDRTNLLFERAWKDDRIVGVFADPLVYGSITCPGDPPVGTDADVERLLCVQDLHERGLDGQGVLIAVVDTGFNLAYLNARGKTPGFDPGNSWTYQPGLTPGYMTLGHGTMCAFDGCIAAPRATLADIVLLRPASLMALLSDAVLAYSYLLGQIRSNQLLATYRGLVVTNSWGMFHPSLDFPVGHPGNYSDNPRHPFNIVVSSLERYGADILFAAGNCGYNCPDLRCQGVTTRTIYGANSHADVLSVAGVDTTRQRVGYSAAGPERLMNPKPDLCGYTHFAGSGVYPADAGTSAACPVVAGVVAAVRAHVRYDPARPESLPGAIRQLVLDNTYATTPGVHSFDYGWGIVDPCRIVQALRDNGIL